VIARQSAGWGYTVNVRMQTSSRTIP
jgi:hypothetical protein